MLHLTAYARTLNPAVIVVAGGPAIRALPRRAALFFDYSCTGDIEALQDIARETLGPDCVASDMFPRFDLAEKHTLAAYVESSRNCNFRCSFCSLTGEKLRYRHYDLAFLERQLLAAGKRHIVLIDNNFYGNDRTFFEQRVALLRDFFRNGRIRSWSALVTGDFFARPENLRLVREAGCLALFSGVESFDSETLRSYNKRHSTVLPQVEMIRDCLEAGVLFLPLWGYAGPSHATAGRPAERDWIHSRHASDNLALLFHSGHSAAGHSLFSHLRRQRLAVAPLAAERS
jgi:radical SAM superfamily enzyme YgiQ (UPF0313 family)